MTSPHATPTPDEIDRAVAIAETEGASEAARVLGWPGWFTRKIVMRYLDACSACEGQLETVELRKLTGTAKRQKCTACGRMR